MVPSMKSAIYVLVVAVSLLMAAYQPAHPVRAQAAKSTGTQATHVVRTTAEKLWCIAMSNLAAVNGLHP